ncbi:MAG: hypothetical protein A2096_10670 [Spirochaetes bacterium GWF1_41_5]|nr:MAG: hypothetical protein A2096_10670 [Spirochaetes bacterium GWF1_41_5]HBE02023.1 hypothetical protein [Spirochaetia bacterium]
MDLSISTTIFGPDYPLDQLVKICKNAGFRFIEISRKHHNAGILKTNTDAYGIKVWAVHGTLGFNAVSMDKSARKKALNNELDRMNNMSIFAPCPYVVHYLNRFNNPSCSDIFLDSLEKLHYKARETGFILAVETVPDKPENERYPDSAEIARVVKSFDSPQMQICIDVNHSNLAENLEDVFQNCRGLISTVHISDNHGKKEDHLPPGKGIIDFSAVLKLLRDTGYCGTWNIECHIDRLPEQNDITALFKENSNLTKNQKQSN